MTTPAQLENACVLVTGGTRGMGLAVAREFARAKARVVVTHKWGSVDEAELQTRFFEETGAQLDIQRSDAGDGQEVASLMTYLRTTYQRLDVVVSNTALAKVTERLADLKRNTFEIGLQYSAWPLIELIQRSHESFGRFPRYIVAISSQGVDHCHAGYEFAGASKAVLETFCRYMAVRLRKHDVRVNAVRPGFLDTTSSRATFGSEAIDSMKSLGWVLDPTGAARVCVGLCSGLMDAVNGQVITADEGLELVGPIEHVMAGRLRPANPT